MDAAMIVKRIRALSGVTRKELAELADLAPSTIGRIERGTLDPTWGTLSRILEATGYRINGDTVVSAGDPTAIAAARRVLESLFVPASAATVDVLVPAMELLKKAADTVVDLWLRRWARAGWLSERTDVDHLVSMAVAAGNAGKITRRKVARRNVTAPDGWRALARRMEEEGIAYAVSGLVAARPDRSTAISASPVIYVEDPSQAVAKLCLDETAPTRGVLLIAPASDELTRLEIDGGIRFVSRAQGVLDAFAGSGREPDKAEDVLRSLLTVAA